MSRYVCPRCDEVYFIVKEVNDEPHLCKAIRKRLERRERQVQAVIPFLECPHYAHIDAEGKCAECREIAEGIVKVLSQLGVEDD